jgi:hypothetical protein
MLSVDYLVAEIKRELRYFQQGAMAYIVEYRRKTIPPRELALMELVVRMQDSKIVDDKFKDMKEAKGIE